MRTNSSRCLVVLLCAAGLAVQGRAQQLMPLGVDLSENYVLGVGYIDTAGWGVDMTDGVVRTMAPSIGQLMGLNPTNGLPIVGRASLIPLRPRFLRTDQIQMPGPEGLFFFDQFGANVMTLANGVLYANGAGITNLPAGSFQETDPVFGASAASTITMAHIVRWEAAVGRTNGSPADPLGLESDPVFAASAAARITSEATNAWTAAHGWGDHSAAGYLRMETDPVFGLSPASTISETRMAQWDEAVAWGNHGDAGYLWTENDPLWSANDPNYVTLDGLRPMGGNLQLGGNAITDVGADGLSFSDGTQLRTADVQAWAAALTWGNHALAGYLKTEVDPAFNTSPAATITAESVEAWNVAAGWGDHASAGYLTQSATDLRYLQSSGGSLTGNLDLSGAHVLNLAAAPGDFTDPREAVSKAYVDNLLNGLQWKPSVKSVLDTPPASPADGDRHLVGTSPTGDWTGHANHLAQFNGGAWDFAVPAANWAVFAESTSNGYAYTSAGDWTQFAGSNTSIWGTGLASSGNLVEFDAAWGDNRYAASGGVYSKAAADAAFVKTETDPLFTASPAAGIAAGDLARWSAAFAWGDHGAQGYLTGTQADTRYFTPSLLTNAFFSPAVVTSNNLVVTGGAFLTPADTNSVPIHMGLQHPTIPFQGTHTDQVLTVFLTGHPVTTGTRDPQLYYEASLSGWNGYDGIGFDFTPTKEAGMLLTRGSRDVYNVIIRTNTGAGSVSEFVLLLTPNPTMSIDTNSQQAIFRQDETGPFRLQYQRGLNGPQDALVVYPVAGANAIASVVLPAPTVMSNSVTVRSGNLVVDTKVGVGTAAPQASAALDVTSTNKGVLLPRLTRVQRDAITGPALGLLIYQTDEVPGFYFFSGSGWLSVAEASGVASVTASSPLASSGGTAPNLTLPPATVAQPGYLTAADWTTFNSKVSGAGSPGSLAKFTTAGTLGDSAVNDDGTHIGIGTSSFDPGSPETLRVDSGSTTSYNVISGHGSVDNYLQLNIKNHSAGPNASADIVATANNGDENNHYVDLGINSSAYANPAFTIGGANDAYLYNMGQNLSIGTGTGGKAIKFHTGGTLAVNERMRIDGDGVVTLNSQSRARVFLGTNWTYGFTNVWKVVPINAKTFDSQTEFSTVDNRFTARVAGYYQVNVQLTYTGTLVMNTQLQVRKNGATTMALGEVKTLPSNAYVPLVIGNLVYLAAGDYLEILFYASRAVTVTGASERTFFSIHKSS